MTRWQVFTAVALRRLPELLPRPDPIVTKVQQIFSAHENAKSHYSDHEMRHLDDIKLKDSEDLDVVIRETAQDMFDKWSKEKSQFEYGKYDDRLSKTQILFMKSNFGSDTKEQWLLPQMCFDRKLGDQNLLDTARRVLKEKLNIINGFRIPSKVPSSVYSFEYPKKVVEKTGFDGSKVFFLKANLDLPDQSVLDALDESKKTNLKWLTMDEAQELVEKHYWKGLGSGLLDETPLNIKRVFRMVESYKTASNPLRVSQ